MAQGRAIRTNMKTILLLIIFQGNITHINVNNIEHCNVIKAELKAQNDKITVACVEAFK